MRSRRRPPAAAEAQPLPSLPPPGARVLNWNETYSATHSSTLYLEHSSGGSPIDIAGGIAELGNWQSSCQSGVNDGLPLTDSGTQDGNGTEIWIATLDLTGGYDFVTTSPGFKASYGVCNIEGGFDHTMNDDVLNFRALRWTAGDSTSF